MYHALWKQIHRSACEEVVTVAEPFMPGRNTSPSSPRRDFRDEDVFRVADFGAGVNLVDRPVPDLARIGVEFHGDLLADFDVRDVLVADLDFHDHAIQRGDFVQGLAGGDRRPFGAFQVAADDDSRRRGS